MKPAKEFLEEQKINPEQWFEGEDGRVHKLTNLLTNFFNQQIRTYVVHRNSKNGRLVKKTYADANPNTTTKETRIAIKTTKK